MSNHYLKCWPEYFQAVIDGRKTFEVRKKKKNFRTGDRIMLQEYTRQEPIEFTGRFIFYRVTYVLENFIGLNDQYVVLGMIPWNDYPHPLL